MTSTRERILIAAGDLLREHGLDGMSTRAIGATAEVQAPTIYRLFGDKQGLLDAVAERSFADYVESKAALVRTDDPVEDLRRGWELHVGFGLANPAVYAAVYGSGRPETSAVAVRAAEILAGMVHRIAAAGRLRVSERDAAQIIHACGRGTTLSLISQSPEERDPRLSELAREAAVAAVTSDDASSPATALDSALVTVRAAVPGLDALSPAEARLFEEWLDRIVAVRSTSRD